MSDYSRNLMPFLADIEPDEAGPNPVEVSRRYGVALQDILILSRNENPYGPSPRVREALSEASLHRYPDPQPFVSAVANYVGFPEENIVAGAGMDEIIMNIARLFLGRGDKALIPIPTYNLYALAARLCQAQVVRQPMLSGFELNPHIPDGMKMVFICAPNNPTGSIISEETARAILEGTEGMVFLDEAYAEFAEKSLISLVKEYDNLVVGRTLSKAFGLAGLRLGYAVAPQWLAAQYRRVAPLFSMSSASLAAGVVALKDLDYMKKTTAKIIAERERLLLQLDGAHPSQGNFICIFTQERSSIVAERLLCQGVVVRDCSSFPGAGMHCLRVSIGTPEQNDRFLEAFAKA
ncbi:MAG: Aspartate aminotransferase [Methanosaeta sp. PtaB.Bin018]|nr:MAG: Aspartate aminotransferase [Methanosaeta sp. PtaB.Bin018]OPY47320.1 MAG: Aspartate aminotransferase [Methanosaeta sp. PtaU1.Bin016]